MIEKDNKEVKLSSTGKPISPNNPNQTPNQGGRPSKLDKFLEAMEIVLNEGLQSVIMSDEELFILCNEQLEEENQIGYTTFKQYKANSKTEDSELFKRFQSLYKKALIKQKNNLFNNLSSDNPQWQKYAWIIERKFKEWNLKTISENTNNNTNKNVNLNKDLSEVSDEELAKILDS